MATGIVLLSVVVKRKLFFALKDQQNQSSIPKRSLKQKTTLKKDLQIESFYVRNSIKARLYSDF